MIAFLNILTVLYLMSFIFVFYFFLGGKNQEVNSLLGIKKGDVYGIFFIFPFMAIGIFILELLNSISYLFTKKLFFQQSFFSNLKEKISNKAEQERERRKKRLESLEQDFKNIKQQFYTLKMSGSLTTDQEKLFKLKLREIQNEIKKEQKIIEQL